MLFICLVSATVLGFIVLSSAEKQNKNNPYLKICSSKVKIDRWARGRKQDERNSEGIEIILINSVPTV